MLQQALAVTTLLSDPGSVSAAALGNCTSMLVTRIVQYPHSLDFQWCTALFSYLHKQGYGHHVGNWHLEDLF